VLDIGSTKVVCLIARIESDGSPRVLGFGWQRGRGVKGGSIVDLEEAERAIRAAVGQAEEMADTRLSGAIVNLSRSLAITYIKQGIRSNVVCPGFIDTPMVAAVTPLFDDPAVAASLTPIARPAQPEEIASVNAFFASDDSSYCNGSTLVVDGGCTARSFAG
jgi:NAD(P)-dependent dehydrogenase (short-subunit alcohol dehydrogenase family)